MKSDTLPRFWQFHPWSFKLTTKSKVIWVLTAGIPATLMFFVFPGIGIFAAAATVALIGLVTYGQQEYYMLDIMIGYITSEPYERPRPARKPESKPARKRESKPARKRPERSEPLYHDI